jgi:lysozyme family protein
MGQTINEFLPYLLAVEGKTSKDPNDPAAQYVPAGAIHTVKGITYPKFETAMNTLGLSSSYSNFINMNMDLYKKVLSVEYFNNPAFSGWWRLYDTKPTIALFFIDWAYNRGDGGFESDIAKYQRNVLKIVDNDITLPETFSNFKNSKYSQDQLLVGLFWRRLAVYKKIDQNRIANGKPSVYKGWANRVKKFYKTFASQNVLNKLKSQGVVF